MYTSYSDVQKTTFIEINNHILFGNYLFKFDTEGPYFCVLMYFSVTSLCKSENVSSVNFVPIKRIIKKWFCLSSLCVNRTSFPSTIKFLSRGHNSKGKQSQGHISH